MIAVRRITAKQDRRKIVVPSRESQFRYLPVGAPPRVVLFLTGRSIAAAVHFSLSESL